MYFPPQIPINYELWLQTVSDLATKLSADDFWSCIQTQFLSAQNVLCHVISSESIFWSCIQTQFLSAQNVLCHVISSESIHCCAINDNTTVAICALTGSSSVVAYSYRLWDHEKKTISFCDLVLDISKQESSTSASYLYVLSTTNW
jgi:hypothetical protein